MNRREILAFFSLVALNGLFPSIGWGQNKFYLNTINLPFPPGMDLGEFERQRRALVDLPSFEKFNEQMKNRGLLIGCHVHITDREATWHNLFRDRSAFLAWEKQRPKYSHSSAFHFRSTECEVSRGDLEKANLDFLLA